MKKPVETIGEIFHTRPLSKNELPLCFVLSSFRSTTQRTMMKVALLSLLLAVCVGTLSARQLRYREEQSRDLQIGGLCAQFWSPTFFSPATGFMEYTIPTPFVVSNYFLWINTTVASLDAGILVSWNLYGSLGTSNNTAPTTATDSSWVLLNSETGVDFSVPQNSFLPEVYAYNVTSNGVAYPYFGFVFDVPAPPPTFVCPVVRCPFGSTFPFPSPNTPSTSLTTTTLSYSIRNKLISVKCFDRMGDVKRQSKVMDLAVR